MIFSCKRQVSQQLLTPAEAFMTLDRMTSAGAQIVVATVPAPSDANECNGSPSGMAKLVMSWSLNQSYETSWDA